MDSNDKSLADLARMDAESARLELEKYERERPPSEIQRLMVGVVEKILDIQIDAHSVRDLGYDGNTYYVGEVDVAGLTFRQRFLSNSNGVFAISVGPTVTKRTPRPWWFGGGYREVVREDVRRIGDLDGLLDEN